MTNYIKKANSHTFKYKTNCNKANIFCKSFSNDVLFETSYRNRSRMVPELNRRGILKQFLQK